MDLTVQGGQSSASYMESAADWPPHTTRAPRKAKMAQFCAAPWPNFTPALTGVVVQIQKLGDLLAGLSIIQQQDRIRPPSNAMVLALAADAGLKFTAF